MATSTIVGTIKGSETELIGGKLYVMLDAPLIDPGTTPDSVHYPKLQVHTITSGNLNTATPAIVLQRSDEITYEFRFTYSATDQIFYLDGIEYAKVDSNGTKFGGAWHLHTDSQYYTGEIHSALSKLLVRFLRAQDIDLFEPFHARIPTTAGATIEWSELQHSNINTSNIDTSAFFIAGLIVQRYAQDLIDAILVPRGNWSAGTTYNKNDVVYYTSDNNVYWYINSMSSAGNLPTNTTYWMLLIEGSDITPDPIDPSAVLTPDPFGVSWNGLTNRAPTADALYDKIITLASLADATFTTLKAPTRGPTTNNTDVATTAFVQTAIAGITVPPATTAPNIADLSDNSTKITNTNFLKRAIGRYAKATNQISQGTAGGGISGGFALRNLNTLDVNDTEVTNGLTSGYLQLKAGIYYIEAYSCVSAVGQNRAVLVDSTGTFLILGSSENAAGNGYETRLRGNVYSRICGEISLGTTTNIGIRHYAEITGLNAEELGRAANRAGPEIYASIEAYRID